MTRARLAWGLVLLAVAGAAGRLQVPARAPLSWDEAARVDSGSALVFALRSARPGALWEWLNAQTYYPFLTPAAHGLALLVTGDPLVAAWAPTAAAYGLVGLLAACLVRSLGGRAVGTCLAALLCWTSPINVRLTPGAFTENFGACALLLVLLALVRLERTGRSSHALAAGGAVALAALVKYDYGIAALGFVGASGLAAFLAQRGWAVVRRYAIVAGSAVLPVVALFVSLYFNAEDGLRSVAIFIFQPGIERRIDFLYYPRLLFTDAEIGLAPLIAFLLLFGSGWILAAWRRRPELRSLVLAVSSWLVVYSFAAAKQARFAALILPVLFVVLALAIDELRARPELLGRAGWVAFTTLTAAMLLAPGWSVAMALLPAAAGAGMALVHPRGVPALRVPAPRLTTGALAAAAAVPLAFQLVPQASSLDEQLWFLRPSPAASDALAFASANLPGPTDRPVLMIGASNGFSIHVLRLEWSEQLGRRSPRVELVPEAPPWRRRDALLDAIRRFSPSRIVAVSMGPESRLVDLSVNGELLFPSQRDYARIAADLAEADVLAPVADTSVDFDPVRVAVWEVRPTALTGFLRVDVSPVVPASILVDGVPRNSYGLGTDVAVGEHEVCFGAVAEYDPPPCRTVSIHAGGTTTVTGEYVGRQGAPGDPGDSGRGGLLTVRTVPAVPSQIVVDGIPRDSLGLNFLRLSPGSHEVCFRYVLGFAPPPCQQVTVEPGASVEVEGRFARESFEVRRG